MNYDVNFFIRKFEAIKDKNIISHSFGSQNDKNKCAFGWCGYFGHGLIMDYPEAHALWLLMKRNINAIPSVINDGGDHRYLQSTPKQRILAALHDIKSMQNKYAIDAKTKESLPEFKEVTFTKIKEQIAIPQSVN